MKSMTGFGRAAGEIAAVRCVIEVRSVNHRFLEQKLRLPPQWQDPAVEFALGQGVRRHVDRGSVSVTVRDEGRSLSASTVRLDQRLAAAYGTALRRLATDLKVAPGPALDAQLLALVAAQPGVLQAGDAAADIEQVVQGLAALLERALHALTAAREREGQALAADLRQRVALLHQHRDAVAELAQAAPDLLLRRLSDRVGKLLGTREAPEVIDPLRLAQEVAYLADRVDISEELTRLGAHLAEFSRLCEAGEQVGRRLDFLTQEMNREVNTIGSKSQSSEVTRQVVAMKAELERLREQIQNVE